MESSPYSDRYKHSRVSPVGRPSPPTPDDRLISHKGACSISLTNLLDLAQIHSPSARPLPKLDNELSESPWVVLLDVMAAVLEDDVLELACPGSKQKGCEERVSREF